MSIYVHPTLHILPLQLSIHHICLLAERKGLMVWRAAGFLAHLYHQLYCSSHLLFQVLWPSSVKRGYCWITSKVLNILRVPTSSSSLERTTECDKHTQFPRAIGRGWNYVRFSLKDPAGMSAHSLWRELSPVCVVADEFHKMVLSWLYKQLPSNYCGYVVLAWKPALIKLGISISDYLNLRKIKKEEIKEGITPFALKYSYFSKVSKHH